MRGTVVKMTSSTIYGGIKRRYSGAGWIVIPDVANATGARLYRRIDAMVIGVWPSTQFLSAAFEIKISRGDYQRDLRDPTKQKFARLFASHFYFATPPGLLRPDEIPDWAGLVEFDSENNGKEIVPSPDLPRMHPSWAFLASVLRQHGEVQFNAGRAIGATP